MSLRNSAAAAIALGALALTIAGCGGGDDEKSAAQEAAERRVELTGGGRTDRGSSSNPAPNGASLLVEELYRQFPPPEPEAGVKGAAAAIKAGEEACAGKTPVEVKQAFYPRAVEAGGLDPDSPKGRMIAGIDRFEEHVTDEISFTAGQLAAATYEATLPPKLASAGFQGCIYALAKELERRLSGKK